MSWLAELSEYWDLYAVEFFRDHWTEPPASLLAALVLAVLLLTVLRKSRRSYMSLPELRASATAAPPDLTVIIPARNEEHNISRCIASFPNLRVIVVDDDSSDATAKVAREAGATVVSAPPLKKNVQGKPNACWAGAREATTKWLLFVDADTWYDPQFAPSLVEFAERNHLQMASVFLRQECRSLAERMLIPYAYALYFCGIKPESTDETRAAEALANGQCLLFRRSSYEFVGGHSAVLEFAVEDIALARIARRHRMRLCALRAEHLGRVHMYDGLKAIWRGFERKSLRFLLVSPRTGFKVMLSSILLTMWLPGLLWLLADGLWAPAALFAALPVLGLRPWYGGLGRALLAPAAIYVFQLIALSNLLTTSIGRPLQWKGRRV